MKSTPRQNLLGKLQQAYESLANFTKPKCAQCKPVPFGCCAPEYCDLAKDWALTRYGIELQEARPKHPTLPFMGPNGCTVPPYLRPVCTVHTCEINSKGFTSDEEWDKAYFRLRSLIDRLEYQRMQKGKGTPKEISHYG